MWYGTRRRRSAFSCSFSAARSRKCEFEIPCASISLRREPPASSINAECASGSSWSSKAQMPAARHRAVVEDLRLDVAVVDRVAEVRHEQHVARP